MDSISILREQGTEVIGKVIGHLATFLVAKRRRLSRITAKSTGFALFSADVAGNCEDGSPADPHKVHQASWSGDSFCGSCGNG
jgi:hypothetical protein